jgi:hypothetical protein
LRWSHYLSAHLDISATSEHHPDLPSSLRFYNTSLFSIIPPFSLK